MTEEAPIVQFPQKSSPGGFGSPFASMFGGETKINPMDYWRIVKRHRWGIIALALLGALIGGFRALSAVPIYQAKLTMLVEPSLPRIVANQEIVSQTSPYLFYETQYDIIRSRAVATRVVEKLDLVDRPQLFGGHRKSVFKLLLGDLGIGAKSKQASDNNGAGTTTPDIPMTPAERKARTEALVSMVQGGLSVSGGQRSQIVEIRYDSPDPKLAAEIANATAGAYTELGLESRLDLTRRATSWLTEKLETLRKKLADSENALQAYQQKEGLVDTASLDALSKSRLESLNNDLVEAQAKYADLSKRYGPKFPKLIAAKGQLEEAQRRLREEATQTVDSKQKEFKLAKLERDVSTNKELYNTFLTRFKETDISDPKNITNVQIIDSALVPTAPYKPNKKSMLTTSLMFGLFAGLLLAFAREYLDNTFKTTKDVEEKLVLPVMGLVPLLKKTEKAEHKPERYYAEDSRSSFAESINHIRTGILFSHVDDPPKTILVTSSAQGEGKTTLSSNLALAFSHLGPTLLIDADLRKPRVAQVAGLDRRSGLVEVVAGQLAFKDCLVRDEKSPNLYILKSGTIPPNPLEILSSSRFSNLLAELKKRFEHIVIDTAPLLPVSDAIVLGRVVDGVLLVLKAGETTQAMAFEATKRLRAAKVAPLGVVLSQVSQRKTGYYYNDDYYYSGYYYGYGDKT